MTEWYALRVGLVESVMRGENGDGPLISRRVLREYQVNNDVRTSD